MKFRNRSHSNPLIGLQFWLQGNTFIQPDWGSNDAIIDFWQYPRGGQPTKVIPHFGSGDLIGVTVSVAPAH